jgi:hypothetical protein
MPSQTAVEPVKQPARRMRVGFTSIVDNVAFGLAALAAIWLAWLLATESLSEGWLFVLFTAAFWVVLAYLALPRLHRILTAIYVPDYFIGRARTSDGLLGDPVNLALLGSQAQLETVMDAAGWTRADPVTLRSSWHIVTATLLRRSYHEAPVSPLLLFGRQQDLAYQQEVQGNPAKRHHVRFWRCPPEWYLPGGHRADWLGAGTFDRRVGLSLFTLQITHKIDADTDIERDHVVRSMRDANAAIGVSVIRDFSTGYHARNGGGDAIVTDGNLPVLDLRPVIANPDHAVEADVVEAAADKRPAQIVVGAALLALRGIAWVVFIVANAAHWNSYLRSLHVEVPGVPQATIDAAAFIVAVVALVVVGIAVLLDAALVFLLFRGSNAARLLAMAISAIAVAWAGFDYVFGGVAVSLRADLLGLPLDILLLLALSARGASTWTRRVRYLTWERRFAERRARAAERRASSASG